MANDRVTDSSNDRVSGAVSIDDAPAPLVCLLAGHGGPELPDPIPLAEIPADVHRAYIVLTAEALRRVIVDLQDTPPEAFADLIAEGLAAAGRCWILAPTTID